MGYNARQDWEYVKQKLDESKAMLEKMEKAIEHLPEPEKGYYHCNYFPEIYKAMYSLNNHLALIHYDLKMQYEGKENTANQ